MNTEAFKQEINIKVKLMPTVDHSEADEVATLSYKITEETSFGDLFFYINQELKLEEKEYSPVTIDYDLAEKILNSTKGEVNKNGQIIWDYRLENQKILRSFREIDRYPESFSVICNGPMGSGGPSDIINLLDELIHKFGPYLGFAVDIVEATKIVKGFLKFLWVEKDINAERIEKTIKSRTVWKLGCITTKKFVGKEQVEEHIMSLLEYSKDEGKNEWVDRRMG